MYGKYSTRVCVKRLIQYKAKPSAVFASRHPPEYCIFRTHKQGGAFSVILYFMVTSGSEQFYLVLKLLQFSVIRMSVSVHIIYF